MSPASVKWITGRRKALARAIALEVTQAGGERWDHLDKRGQNAAIASANALIGAWISNGVCLEYDAEFSEPAPLRKTSQHDPTARKSDNG
jgi:hypothetical protein